MDVCYEKRNTLVCATSLCWHRVDKVSFSWHQLSVIMGPDYYRTDNLDIIRIIILCVFSMANAGEALPGITKKGEPITLLFTSGYLLLQQITNFS